MRVACRGGETADVICEEGVGRACPSLGVDIVAYVWDVYDFEDTVKSQKTTA